MAAFGLVADYGTDSDADSETDTSVSVPKSVENTSTSGVNFLSGDGVDSSDSEEDTVAESEPVKPLENPFVKEKLPNPLADKGSGAKASKGGVFVTDYQLAEASKDSILEQHVKMTDAPDVQQKTIGGKKVCWNFRKTGRCNKGSKCPYAHGTDLVTPGGSQGDNTGSDNAQKSHHHAVTHVQQVGFKGSIPLHEEEDESYMGQAKKRKRHGVSDGLAPPKRAYQQLDQVRQKQRPWTQGAPR